MCALLPSHHNKGWSQGPQPPRRKRMKKKLALLSGAVLTTAVVGMAPANADPVEDSKDATCKVLGDHLDGVVADDAKTLAEIADTMSNFYGITYDDAVIVINKQVKQYCPIFWPNLVNVGNSGLMVPV